MPAPGDRERTQPNASTPHDVDVSAVPAFLRGGPARGHRPGRPASPDRDLSRGPSAPEPIDPARLPVPTISRRRLGVIAAALAVGWLVLAFGRQVGEASAASNRADDLRAGNLALRDEVASLQRDVRRVQDPRFIELQARAFGLGGPGEIRFALDAGAPAPASDAPGSAAVRLGAHTDQRSPLESWLTTLFGPDR